MCTPTTREEFEQRFAVNTRLEGRGIAGIMVYTPCPACAAPGFLVHKLVGVELAWQAGAQCVECGRGFRAIFTRPAGTSGGVRFEIVQWRGDDAPAWCAIRRV